eukprot:m.22049 g.22049  ORF g.22049 m.22049 type:complete len:423 (+) comp3951_c0_seq1:63-1331(+)
MVSCAACSSRLIGSTGVVRGCSCWRRQQHAIIDKMGQGRAALSVMLGIALVAGLFATGGRAWSQGELPTEALRYAKEGSELVAGVEAMPYKERVYHSNGKQSPVVVFTALFRGSPPAYFRYFLKSIEKSGVDLIIVGDGTGLPETLPPNVRLVKMRWRQYVRYCSRKLFGGARLPLMYTASAYKTIDTKPLFGFLFRDLIKDYEFWGHVDNDMIIGNLIGFLEPLLPNHDIITPLDWWDCDKEPKWKCARTWGPMTLYRNEPRVTELFRLGDYGLYGTLNSHTPYFFDEWGGSEDPSRSGNDNFERSMTKIVLDYKEKMQIRLYNRGFPIGWDHPCKMSHTSNPTCGQCTLNVTETSQTLVLDRSGEGNEDSINVYEVILCHFQFGKGKTEDHLNNMTEDELISLDKAPVLVWTYLKGFFVP